MIRSKQQRGHGHLRRRLGSSESRSWTGSRVRKIPFQPYLSVLASCVLEEDLLTVVVPQKPNSLQQTFKGQVVEPPAESLPHSALASQLDMQPSPQNTWP